MEKKNLFFKFSLFGQKMGGTEKLGNKSFMGLNWKK